MSIQASVQFLKSIPSAFWGVIAGSVFTLIGVILANLAAEKRQRTQIEADRENKRHETEQNIKKDIYLASSVALGKMITSIYKLSDMKALNNTLESDTSDLSKLYLIADGALANHIFEFVNEHSASFLDLSAQRMRLVDLDRARTIHQESLRQCNERRQQAFDTLKEMELGNVNNPRFRGMLLQQVELASAQETELRGLLAGVEREFGLSYIPFLSQCVSSGFSLAKRLSPIIVAARQDLNLSVEPDTFSNSFDQHQATIQENLQKFLKQVSQPADA